jgi:hypothetical protein
MFLKRSRGAFILVLMLPTAPALADKPAGDGKLEKKATDIVKQACELIKNAKTMHVDQALNFMLDAGQGKRTVVSEATCDVERPNRFALRVKRKGEEGGVYLVCDGKTLCTAAVLLKQYTQSPAPPDLYKIGAALMPLDMRNTGAFYGDVLGEDPYELLMTGVNSCTYVAKEKVGGTETHHLKFEQDAFNWDMWIAAEGKPFVVKLHMYGDGGNAAKFDFEQSFSNWRIDEPLAKDAFNFSPAKDAKKLDNLEMSAEKK